MNLIEYETILKDYLPTELIEEIEVYYVSLFYYENVSMPIKYLKYIIPKQINSRGSFRAAMDSLSLGFEFGLGSGYYANPLKYLQDVAFDRTKSHEYRIVNVCRYWIYNSDLIQKKMSSRAFKNLKTTYISLLVQNLRHHPSWNVGKFYYRQICFREYQ